MIGEFHTRDRHIINEWNYKMNFFNSAIEIIDFLPKKELHKKFEASNGLLLLSVSRAAIPSKFFDYLNHCRPILVFGESDSSLQEVCNQTPFVFFVENKKSCEAQEQKIISDFFLECLEQKKIYKIPNQFKDEFGKSIFRDVINSLAGL